MILGGPEEVRIKLKEKAYPILEDKLNNIGYSEEELRLLDIPALQEKLNKINSLLENREELRKLGGVEYKVNEDFRFLDKSSSTTGYTFYPYANLVERKKIVLDLIKNKSREEKINSIEDLINNIADKDLRQKIERELEDFNNQNSKFEKQEKEIDKNAKEYEISKKELEISKTKLDLFEKKSQIWLTILAKESIASIIGAILLIIISICLLVSMFIGLEPSKIIESTFLLILGYFFGHAVSKKSSV